MKRTRGVCIGWMAWLVAVGIVAIAAGPAAWAADEFACVAADKLEKNIVAGAELEPLVCFFAPYEGKNVLHFKVGVKNATDQAQRFRVNLFLDNGKAVGGLIPVKTKAGLVKPGETGRFVYPVTGMTDKPAAVTVRVSAISE